MDVFHLAAPGIVDVTDTTWEQPWVGVHKHLFRGIKLTEEKDNEMRMRTA
jgi:hypothetical protein